MSTFWILWALWHETRKKAEFQKQIDRAPARLDLSWVIAKIRKVAITSEAGGHTRRARMFNALAEEIEWEAMYGKRGLASQSQTQEWICEKCDTVYPGPPQPGVKCVICPQCGGETMPRTTAEIRKLRTENTTLLERTNAAEAKVAAMMKAILGVASDWQHYEEELSSGPQTIQVPVKWIHATVDGKIMRTCAEELRTIAAAIQP